MNVPNLMKAEFLASAAFAALCIGATGANAGVLKSDVFGHDANGTLNTNQPFVFTSTAGPVNYTIAMPSAGPVARSSHFGAASAAQETLRAAADLRVNSLQTGPNVSAKTSTHFYKEVLVGSGTSGLKLGDAIQLDLALRLDGSASVGYINSASNLLIPDNYRLLTSADISFKYSVADLNQQDTEGSPLELARLRSFGDLDYDYEGKSTGNTLSSSRRFSWDAFSTVNGALGGLFVADRDDVAGSLAGSTAYSLDTGLLRLQIDTFVGNTLAIDGFMDIFLQAYAWDDDPSIAITASSLGDFSSTFDADLSSSVAGIVLEGEQPGVYLASAPPPVNGVPEPMTLSLLGAALAGLGLMRRRKTLGFPPPTKSS